MARLSAALCLLVASLLLAGCVIPGTPSEPPAPTSEDVGDSDDGAGLPVSLPDALDRPAEASEPDETPTLKADVAVDVDASVGPQGGEPVEIDRRIYGMNVADWQPQDYKPEPDPTFLAYLSALHPGILRWPAGESSQEYRWSRDGTAPEPAPAPRAPRMDSVWDREWLWDKEGIWRTKGFWPSSPSRIFVDENATGGKVLTPDDVDAFVRLASEVDAKPVLAVNLKTGTPREAADLVRYANVEKGYGVEWWQLGNEPDFPDGRTQGPEDYAQRFVEFAKAMREVDPGIKLVGGELMTGAHATGSNGAPDWLTPILAKAGAQMDAVSWHYYPLDGARKGGDGPAAPSVENLFQEEAGDWRPAGLSFIDEVVPAVARARDADAPDAELWVTEYGEDPYQGGAEGLVDTQAGALWAAEALGRFAAQGVDAMAKFVFKSGGDHRFTLLDPDMRPRPSYYAYWLYANHFGERVVNASSDAKTVVNAHAALREDGALAVVLVNKDAREHVVDLGLEGFEARNASRYQVAGESVDAREVTVNGVELTSEVVMDPSGVQPDAVDVRDLDALALAPASVTLLVITS